MIKSTDLQTWNSLETSLKSDEAIIQFIDIDNSVETGYFRKDYIALITIPGSTDPEYVYLCNSDQLNTILQRRTNENDRTYVQRIYGFLILIFRRILYIIKAINYMHCFGNRWKFICNNQQQFIIRRQVL